METLEGLMSFVKMEDGLSVMDFLSYEYAELSPLIAKCKVQVMRDGNVYITELPKRLKNHALFREDNSTLTLGRDGKYYFVFTLTKDAVKELPDRLVNQALAIAQKVDRKIIKRKEVRK